jgi:hypothetical protein
VYPDVVGAYNLTIDLTNSLSNLKFEYADVDVYGTS